MDAATRARGARLDPRARRRRRFRLFAAPADEPRARRVTDAILLAVALLGLLALSLVAVPPAGFERALIALLANVPGGVAGLWLLLFDLLALFAVVLPVAAAVRRRWALLRDVVLAVAVVLAIAVVVGRIVAGAWPAVLDSLRADGPPAWFPSLRLTLPIAVVLVAAPHLSRSARRLGAWAVVLGSLSATILAVTTPSGALAGLLVATIGATVVHLGVGSPRGRPSLDDVAAALRGLGIEARELGAADRQPTGLFLVHAEDDAGRPLVAKVYGRDAHDTQLLTSVWRTVWFRDPGSPIALGRLQQAQHEAFLTLLAHQAGIVTEPVVTAGATTGDDVVLVLRPVGPALADDPERWGDTVVAQVWTVLQRLHATGIAHGQVDDDHLILDGSGTVGLVDFRGAMVAPLPERLRTDRAQALVTTVLAVGQDRALPAALAALGPDGLAEVLAFLQPTALTGPQRTEVRRAGLDLDALRARAAAEAGVDPPELQRLRRVSLGSILQVVLLAFAFLALASGLGGLDLGALGEQLGDATWGFVVVGFFLAQTPRLSQSVATLGASPVPVGLGPLYGLQLAASYINLAVPATAARVAVNIRFFQRKGLPAGSALAVGAIDGFASFVVQISLLLSVVLLTPASLDIDLDSSASSGLVRLIGLLVALAVAAIAVVLIVPRFRRPIFAWIGQLGTEAFAAVRGLRSPRRLGLLLGGTLATELLFASALGVFARAFGFSIGLDELLLINVSVSLLAGLLPIPGGIGVVEGGLTFGLVRAGLPEETAFAIALLYRLSTFYLPPIWGFFALKWLERNKHL